MRDSNFSCGMEAALDLIAGKWKLLILYRLASGPQRFGALRRLVGDVSEKIMSEQLKALANDGLVQRIDFRTVPPHVEYELTEFGRGFCESFAAVCEWGTKNIDQVSAIAAAREQSASKSALAPPLFANAGAVPSKCVPAEA
jgi:DNA-binding HxlR family transcriptional regulator